MSENNNSIKRPLSPHLQVYRLPMMAKMSISHRITGVLLTMGLVVMAIWFLAAGLGEDSYNKAMVFIDTPMTELVFAGWAFALFYHMANGIRHMFWDVGIGLNEKAAISTGWIVLLFALAATALSWLSTCDCYKQNNKETAIIEEAADAQE